MSGPIINKIRVKELKFQFLKGVENRVNVLKQNMKKEPLGSVTVVTVIPVSTTGWSIESV